MTTYPEHAHAINGVDGRMFASYVRNATLGTFSTQTWKASREYNRDFGQRKMVIELRFDDACGNGHNTFAATCTIYEKRNGVWRDSAGGAAHEEMAEVFPELAALLPWHLVGTDGPMHYVANTIYLAGDRDHRGLRKGESRQLRNGKTGLLCWQLSGHSLPRYVDAAEKPLSGSLVEYVPWMIEGEGKERQLDAARSTAVWPDATDAQLTADDLAATLAARLPALLTSFRAAMESCGFAWRAES